MTGLGSRVGALSKSDSSNVRFGRTDVFMILGRRGCGKSHLARAVSSCYPRKVIIDTMHEHGGGGSVVCHSFKDFSEKIAKIENEPNFNIVLRYEVDSDYVIQEFNQTLRILYYLKNSMIHIEEIQRFSSAGKMPKWLEECLTTGRHQGIALLFTTQMPKLCHKALIASANHVLCGSLHETNDIKYTRGIFHQHTEELARLPEREFLYFRPGHELLRIDNDWRERRGSGPST